MTGEDTSYIRLYISSTSVQPDIDIFMRQDAIIWQFYSHGCASSYGFVEDFRRAATARAHLGGGGDSGDCMVSPFFQAVPPPFFSDCSQNFHESPDYV